jgi:hypothetical protein
MWNGIAFGHRIHGGTRDGGRRTKMSQQLRTKSAGRTPPPPPPPPQIPQTESSRTPTGTKLPTRRIPWREAAIAFLAGCVAGAASALIIASGTDADDAAALRERVAQLEATQSDLAAEVIASEERADAAEAEAERARQRAARERREADRAGSEPARPSPARAGRRSVVAVDWGGFGGLFALSGTRLRATGDSATVRGEIRYLGGAPCAVGNVELTATFFAEGRQVGTARWSAPALAEDEPVVVRASAGVDRAPKRVELLMTDARCAA